MDLCKCGLLFLLLAVDVRLFECNDELNAEESEPDCSYVNGSEPSEDLVFTADQLYSSTKEQQLEFKKKSRVCLPDPCAEIEAYSGFINADKWGEEENSFLFYLYIRKKAVENKTRPILLWLQGGPGKSSLFGEFLENGPLGINASGNLYYRKHTLFNQADIIYLDQPAGSGYSFVRKSPFNGTLETASDNIARFLMRFPLIYWESRGRELFIGGESYGARFAIGAASKILNNEPIPSPLVLKGVMLGVGFLFPLLDIIDSTEYLYYTGLLDEDGKAEFFKRFCDIQGQVKAQNYSAAAALLSQTVLNLRTPGSHSLFETLTGFQHHASIIEPVINKKILAYYGYANSTEFKKIIHVNSSRPLDGARSQVAKALAVGDFFVDVNHTLKHVLNNRHALIYTAELDDVFPAINIEREFKKLEWRGSDLFKEAKRKIWYEKNNSSLRLYGYRKRAGTLLFANVLFGGHYIFMDRSHAVSELYRRFFIFQKVPPPNSNVSISQKR